MNNYWFLCHKGLVKDHEVIWSTNTAIQLSVSSLVVMWREKTRW